MAGRIGIDTGGTHTDLVYVDDAGVGFHTLKVPTTPDDLSRGVLDGLGTILDEAGSTAAAITRFVYGSTLVTNLIIEGGDVAVGLLTTEGFRDVIEIGRASRKLNIYDIHWRPPVPLVPRHLRLDVSERIDHKGGIVTPLNEEAARVALRHLRDAGVESIAICFLNAYANPVHEQRMAALAAEECPDVEISLSSDVVREFREYERMSTTAVNAYVAGPLKRHLDDLAANVSNEGVPATPAIMRSNGGVMTFAAAKRLPVALTHSGPMGGIVGGTAIAAACGIDDIITLDMGGTSADVSLVAGGQPVLTTRGKLGHFPVLLPMLDLVTIGAGGGSIAWVDEGGAMRVGPRSAGSVPGPACYSQGGTEPALTDANLLAGRLNADYFLAGKRGLSLEKSEAAIRERVAEPVGISLGEATMGIMAIAESHMVNAIKLISVERGLDPRDFTLVAFGGCGPLHAARLAEELAISRVLIPAAPGNVSAMGMLAADIRHDLVRTHVRKLQTVDPVALAAEFEELLAQGAGVLNDEGIEGAQRRMMPAVDLRYQGQNYELTLALPGHQGESLALADLTDRFHAEHRRVYGYDLPGRGIQLVNLRLTAFGAMPVMGWPRYAAGQPGGPVAQRQVLIADGDAADVPVYRVDDLCPDQEIAGPAVVEYAGSTLFVPGSWTATIDDKRNALLVNGDGGAP